VRGRGVQPRAGRRPIWRSLLGFPRVSEGRKGIDERGRSEKSACRCIGRGKSDKQCRVAERIRGGPGDQGPLHRGVSSDWPSQIMWVASDTERNTVMFQLSHTAQTFSKYELSRPNRHAPTKNSRPCQPIFALVAPKTALVWWTLSAIPIDI
jgi:hypothetical protein